jgi:hypothetical protein
MNTDAKMEALGAYNLYPDVPGSEDQLEGEAARIEAGVGAPLPPAYRAFVMRFGQFAFDRGVYCPSKGSPCGDRFRLSRIYGLRPAKANTLASALKTYRGRIPDHTIPVACDPGGNQLVLSLGGDDREHVYSWDHEFRALGWKNLQKWTARLEDEGVDVSHASSPAIIREYERRHPDELKWKPGYGNLYLAARCWEEFIGSLVEYPE